MTPETRRRKIALAQTLYAGFYRCPTTGRVIEALPGDDKVLCGCRRSNPAVPTEATERTGTHLVRFLTPATVEEYVDERAERQGAEPDDDARRRVAY